ncbi:MAG TPA: cytochrome c [Longimicrobiales bacterium]|nr:cytochrome c [Longimicrobiales bacterium]
MRAALTILLTLLVVLGIGAAVALSGAINVAAIESDSRATQWALGTVARRSIARRAGDAGSAPAALDSAALASGLDHFHAMCVDCHGAPGLERSEAGEGLNPPAPDLSEVVEAEEWSDAEMFWIVKNGIRMTGMPAFGPTHSDQDLWAIVGVVKALPEWGEAGYRARIDALRAAAAADSTAAGRTHVHVEGGEQVH